MFAFVGSKNDAPEGVIEGEVVVECTRVLGGYGERDAQAAEGAAVDAVGVSDAVDVRAGGVDGVVDHVGGGVEEANRSAIYDVAVSRFIS